MKFYILENEIIMSFNYYLLKYKKTLESKNFINYPKTPKQLAISIHEAKNYFKDNHNTGAPWNPSKAVSEEWLANPNHNPDRQRGIDQWVRLSKMKVSDTGYKVVTIEGKLQVIPI